MSEDSRRLMLALEQETRKVMFALPQKVVSENGWYEINGKGLQSVVKSLREDYEENQSALAIEQAKVATYQAKILTVVKQMRGFRQKPWGFETAMNERGDELGDYLSRAEVIQAITEVEL